MGVEIHREREGRVPQPLLNYLRMLALSQEEGGRSVPEIVEPDVRQSRPFEQRLERAPLHILGPERRAPARAEHEVVILPIRGRLALFELSLAVVPALLEDELQDGYRP